MDVQLPEMDGLEATRRIKADPELRAIPLVVVTSYALSGDEAKALAAGADAYVTKPFSPRQLLAKVRELLENLGTIGGAAPVNTRAATRSPRGAGHPPK